MAAHTILLFGDQNIDILPSIRRLFRISRRSTTLQKFLRDTADVIQLQIAELSASYRDRFYNFNTLLDLAERVQSLEIPDPLPATILIFAIRLGELILHAEDDTSILSPESQDVSILAVCTGQLPAVAAQYAKSVNELLAISVDLISITIRLAIETCGRSEEIEAKLDSWAYLVTGGSSKDYQIAIDGFHRDFGIPTHRHAYISVSSEQWVTICGPPTVLDNLFGSVPLLNAAPCVRLPIAAAVHAPHLHGLDIDKVIGERISSSMPLPTKAPMLSTFNGVPYDAKDLRTLIKSAIQDIAEKPLNLSEVITSSLSRVSKGTKVVLRVLGESAHLRMVEKALQMKGCKAQVKPLPEFHSPTLSRQGSEQIAIVGYSGRFPGSKGPEELWEHLLAGHELHEKVPNDRWDINKYYDPDGNGKNTTASDYGCFIPNAGLFDFRLFNISPREAAQMDPLQRLTMMSTYEALEAAGYSQNGSLSLESKRISSFFGHTTDDWKDVQHSNGIDMYYVPAVARAFAPGKLNHYFKWEGASYSVDSACASSSSAVILACKSLLSRDCDMAIAGGGSMINGPDHYAGLSRGGFISPTGGCKTFRADADGYCRAEGIGVVVLKRLEDAIAENDNIRAVIRGFGRNHSAYASSITHPHVGTQQRLLRQVLKASDVEPKDISYVEFHGTATQAGDVAEMSTVSSTIAISRSADNPLFVGAVKANVGHGEAAAGITSLIKTVMMLEKRVIPPQPGVEKKLNPNYPDLDSINIKFARKPTDLQPNPQGDGKVKILLNNFDAAGGNSCLIVEEKSQPHQKGEDGRSHHIIACSARTAASLRMNQANLKAFLVSNSSTRLSHLAYTTTARRVQEAYRASYTVSSVQELVEQLSSDISSKLMPTLQPKQPPVVFVFTGQGSQYTGMGKDLYLSSVSFRTKIDTLDKLCTSLGFESFLHIIVNDGKSKETSPMQNQLAILSLEIALAEMWKSWGISPDLLIGHSLGEYAAMCIAGVMSVSDALYIIGKRAELLNERCKQGSHAMLAISSRLEVLQKEMESTSFQGWEISCLNGPRSFVISAAVTTLEQIAQHFKSVGIRTKTLYVPYGFHSQQVEPILDDLGRIAQTIPFLKPRVPVISTLLGELVTGEGIFSSEYLVRQTREPVKFAEAVSISQACGIVNEEAVWIEIGPHPTCLALVSEAISPATQNKLPSMRKEESNFKTLCSSIGAAYVAGLDIDWMQFHREHEACLELVDLPKYAFDTKNFWSSYSEGELQQLPDTMPSLASRPELLTTSLQNVITENFGTSDASIEFMSDVSESHFSRTLQEHKLCGSAVCPASMFCDMALSAARYLFSARLAGQPLPPMSVHRLDVTRPLMLPGPKENKHLRVKATASEKEGWNTFVTFTSVTNGQSHEHGTCKITYGFEENRKQQWSKLAYFVKSRVEALQKGAQSGDVNRILKAFAYRLFANVVQYGQHFKGMEEVFIAKHEYEAVSTVRLSSDEALGTFTLSPFHTDALLQLAGFVLNGNSSCPEDIIYLSAGLESFQLMSTVSEDKTYNSYTRMHETDQPGLYTGDLYVLDGDEVIAVAEGISFQKMPKKTLAAILSTAGNANAAKAPQTASRHPKNLEAHVSPPSNTSRVSPNVELTGSTDASAGSDVVETILAAVADETGVSREEIVSSTAFEDIGVDSMMSIAIVDAVNKATGRTFPATLFGEHPLVRDIEAAFGLPSKKERKDTVKSISTGLVGLDQHNDQTISEGPSTDPSTTDTSGLGSPVLVSHTTSPAEDALDFTPLTRSSSNERREGLDAATTFIPDNYNSKVVLLQGKPRNGQTPLFLFVDGAGSASAYIHLPIFKQGQPVYALESPFLNAPKEYKCTIEDVISIFLKALRSVQPSGPYMLGGWSAGAVYAYESSRQLLQEGETILGLLLIDMHVPQPMFDFLEPTPHLLEKAGLVLGITRAGKALPEEAAENLKTHLLSTVKALMYFEPKAMEPSARPNKTVVIWARKGLKEILGDNDDAGNSKGNVMEDRSHGVTDWFFAKRESFGPNGWDKLVGEVECHSIDADHFSMMVRPKVAVTGQIIQKAIHSFLAAQ